ncbi:HAD-IA family hydrolase [Pedobacter nototheniae]|uniref:HAD-IA family hydrolase n=1 Tax=Pedobacter nototheniae TaxID=2488994 RepID=UPI00292CBEB8|nr:HAD-IA family hydrolase [Pedobacter nototheniae]
MSIKLVVFDMAGTTVKDENYVGHAFQQAMKNNGYEIPLKDINPIMGYEKPLAIKMMLEVYESVKENLTDDLIQQIHRDFVERMLQFYRTSDQIVPLPNAEDTFSALRDQGIKIGLDTGFSKNISDVIIERLNWANKVDAVVASDEVPNGRPYPDMIQKMMQQLNIADAAEIAKVGDTEVDVNEGKNAGCKYVIGITTGAFTRAELEPFKPTHIVDDLAEVLGIIGA